jgi:protein phosphatase
MLTHPGRVRDSNEDNVAYVLPKKGSHLDLTDALLLVADGMGGHAAGEVASQIAAQVFHRCYYEQPHVSVPVALMRCVEQANQDIFEASRADPNCAGMGTTCTAVVIRKTELFLAHIGDSRAYLLRGDKLIQLSEDHTLVSELVRSGSLTREEAWSSPQRNIILKALGTNPTVVPQIWKEGMRLLPEDKIMVCSDGLSDLVTENSIKDIMLKFPPYEACEHLINAALQAGGHDNVSVGILQIANFEPDTDLHEMPEHPTLRTTIVPEQNEIR